MALMRFGSNVSFTVFGWTTGLTVIHGYCLWNPASAFLKTCASSPPNGCQSVIVTGVCEPGAAAGAGRASPLAAARRGRDAPTREHTAARHAPAV